MGKDKKIEEKKKKKRTKVNRTGMGKRNKG